MPRAAVLWLALVVASGCLDAPQTQSENADHETPKVAKVGAGTLVFAKKSLPAIGVAMDLYEPTIEVASSGTIYVAGHVIAAITTGTPAYYSRDDGNTWEPLPFYERYQTPMPGQGSAPPPGDEGFIVAGDKGQAWMVDITLAAFPITGWCDEGARQCYHNPNAFDRLGAARSCRPASLNDRPWAAYANGTLLMVNNPGDGGMQLGVLRVPPPQNLETAPARWNFCASSGGRIPGVPGLRDDGLFAVPHVKNGKMYVVLGNVADIARVRSVEAFEFQERTFPNFGAASFDADGVLYVVAENNSLPAATGGRLRLAISSDDGATFHARSFEVGNQVQWYFLDGNRWGPGALLSWAVRGDTADSFEWYAAHVRVGEDGFPRLENPSRVGRTTGSVGDVMGSALGPDGRSYIVTHEGGLVAPLSRPIAAWVQDLDSPRLPTKSP